MEDGNAHQHLPRLPAVGTRTDTQVVVRLWDIQFSEEDRRHPIIVMLSGVHQHLGMACRSQGFAHRCGFNELGSGADYVEDFQPLGSLSTTDI